MTEIQRDIQRHKALFLQATTGVMHQSARKYRSMKALVCVESVAKKRYSIEGNYTVSQKNGPTLKRYSSK